MPWYDSNKWLLRIICIQEEVFDLSRFTKPGHERHVASHTEYVFCIPLLASGQFWHFDRNEAVMSHQHGALQHISTPVPQRAKFSSSLFKCKTICFFFVVCFRHCLFFFFPYLYRFKATNIVCYHYSHEIQVEADVSLLVKYTWVHSELIQRQTQEIKSWYIKEKQCISTSLWQLHAAIFWKSFPLAFLVCPGCVHSSEMKLVYSFLQHKDTNLPLIKLTLF